MAVKLVSGFSYFEGTKEFRICHSPWLHARSVTVLGLKVLIANVGSKSQSK